MSGRWKWRGRDTVKRRHAGFEERGVAVPGTGTGRWRRGRYYGTTGSDPEWNRTHRDTEAEKYERLANEGEEQ